MDEEGALEVDNQMVLETKDKKVRTFMREVKSRSLLSGNGLTKSSPPKKREEEGINMIASLLKIEKKNRQQKAVDRNKKAKTIINSVGNVLATKKFKVDGLSNGIHRRKDE